MFVDEPHVIFSDRHDAGKRLAEKLAEFSGENAIVLAIPCGGVPVGIEVAAALGTDFDLIVPRKIQVPGNPEAGYGAVAEDGTIVLNDVLVTSLGLSRSQIHQQAEEVRAEIARRLARPNDVLSLKLRQGIVRRSNSDIRGRVKSNKPGCFTANRLVQLDPGPHKRRAINGNGYSLPTR